MTGEPPRDVVFLDSETNGLDPRVHEAWEVAAWNLTTGHRCEFFVNIGDVAAFMGRSEPKALRVGRFLDRYPLDDAPTREDTRAALDGLCDVLDGGREVNLRDPRPAPVILGSKPTFDMDFVGNLMRTYNYPPGVVAKLWHHHPIDLGSYAAGVLGRELGTESLSAEAVARMCGVEPGGHSAGGDVTSGGACYLLLRQAARNIRPGEWLEEWRDMCTAAPDIPVAIQAIDQYGPWALTP
jgi:hypothetical protein